MKLIILKFIFSLNITRLFIDGQNTIRYLPTGRLSRMRHLAASAISAVVSADAADRVAAELQSVLGGGAAVVSTPVSDGKIRLEASVPQASVDRALQALLAAHPADVRCTPASLEDLFLRHYKVAGR